MGVPVINVSGPWEVSTGSGWGLMGDGFTYASLYLACLAQSFDWLIQNYLLGNDWPVAFC